MMQSRLDYLSIQDLSGNEDKAKIDELGILRAISPVTRCGVFAYRNPDGSARYEYRPKEEVFSQQSMDSIKQIPITLKHPKEAVVDASVAQREAIGATGDTVFAKDNYVHASFMIFDKDAIDQIKSGALRELSLGYMADIDEVSGVYEGVPYDCIQRNIRYNHLSVVESARAGSHAQIKLDSLGVPMTEVRDPNPQHTIPVGDINTEIFGMKGRMDALEKNTKEIKDSMDKLGARMDAMHKAMQDSKAEKETAEELENSSDMEKKAEKKSEKKMDAADIESHIEKMSNFRADALVAAQISMKRSDVQKIRSDKTEAIQEAVLLANGFTKEDLAAFSSDYKAGVINSLVRMDESRRKADAKPYRELPKEQEVLTAEEERKLNGNGGL